MTKKWEIICDHVRNSKLFWKWHQNLLGLLMFCNHMKTLKTLQLIDYRVDGQNCIKFGVVNPLFKVEKILKCILDLIPSPSAFKYKLWPGKFAWGVKTKLCQRCFALIPEVIIWIFTEGEGDGIDSRLSS